MAWLFLSAAILLEVFATINLKLSDGLTKIDSTIATVGLFALSFLCAAYAIKYIDVGLAYALWSGLGTVAVVAIGIMYFNEPSSIFKTLCIAMILLGVVGLNIHS